MHAYLKGYDGETKWVYFLIEDDDLLKKYNDNWNKVSNNINEDFDSKLICNEKILRTKINSYSDDVTNFRNKIIPEAGSNYTY